MRVRALRVAVVAAARARVAAAERVLPERVESKVMGVLQGMQVPSARSLRAARAASTVVMRDGRAFLPSAALRRAAEARVADPTTEANPMVAEVPAEVEVLPARSASVQTPRQSRAQSPSTKIR